MKVFWESFFAGLGVGSIYSLIGIGYTLILGSSGVFNFAQGTAVVIGAFISYGLGYLLHVPILLVVGVILFAGAVTGVFVNVVAVVPVFKRQGASGMTDATFLSTLGVALTVQAVMALLFGTDVHPVSQYVRCQAFVIGGVPIRPIYVVTVVVVLFATFAFLMISRMTGAGLVMRASLDDLEGASLVGIPISKVIRRTFLIGSMFAALAGFLVSPITYASTGIADQFTFFGFAAMAIGGFGNIPGALVGGLIVGVVGQVSSAWLDPHYSNILIYVVMLVVLLLRPQGLFGSAGGGLRSQSIRDV